MTRPSTAALRIKAKALRREGWKLAAIAVELGRSETWAWAAIHDYQAPSQQERIPRMFRAGMDTAQIAKRLGRLESTVYNTLAKRGAQ